MSNAALAPELLPPVWVDQIFRKLAVRYGRQFLARWEGIDESDVKADWAEHLGGFSRRPDCIAYALESLPSEKPPTVGEFRALCRSKPESSDALRIEHKRGPIPASVMAALDKLKEPSDVAGQYAGTKGWAYRLRDREAAGDKLGAVQRRFWRDALGVDAGVIA